MGRTHALSGAAGLLAVAPVLAGGRIEHHVLTPALGVAVAALGARLAGIW